MTAYHFRPLAIPPALTAAVVMGFAIVIVLTLGGAALLFCFLTACQTSSPGAPRDPIAREPSAEQSAAVSAAIVPRPRRVRWHAASFELHNAPIKFERSAMPPEAYVLTAKPRSVTIAAGSRSGFDYGMTTLRQLFGKARIANAVTIVDGPMYRWRGLHLDVSRHFFPVRVLGRLFRRLFLHELENAFNAGKLRFFNYLTNLAEPQVFARPRFLVERAGGHLAQAGRGRPFHDSVEPVDLAIDVAVGLEDLEKGGPLTKDLLEIGTVHRKEK